MSRLIAIDFDHTLTADSGDPYAVGGETPNREMVDFVRLLKEEKHYDIVVWTARPWSHASHIVGLLTAWEVPYNGLKCEKGGAEAYIDDRAVNAYSDDLRGDLEAVLTHDNRPPSGDDEP